MKYVRTRYLCAVLVVADLTLLAGGVPLQRYSWMAARDPAAFGGAHVLWLLLAANVALLLLAFAGFTAALVLSKRAWIFARGLHPMRYASFFVRSNSARRTNRSR